MDALLDLPNSRPLINGEERDALGDPAEGRRWAREHGGDGSLAELVLLREARDVLRDVACGKSSPAASGPLFAVAAFADAAAEADRGRRPGPSGATPSAWTRRWA
ncbi:ABATE domain-containing protein [Streptomyces griseus]|uniref:ABATE domain-containing protein n=1 Tax=Streptomyces griseus TaxID=1911 RepID=UPI00386C7838